MSDQSQLGHQELVALSNSLHFGVAIVTDTIEPVYLSHRFEAIFDELVVRRVNGVPPILKTYVQQFIEEAGEDPEALPLILDCQPRTARLLRWNVSWFPEPLATVADRRCLLVIVEDCYRDLLIQMKRDQRRYDLTDQEARVWVMLKFGMAYKDISDQLGIKLNTVKTHARNVYTKQRNYRPQAPRLWFLGDAVICNSANDPTE
ncbi:MAG: hypothetical protein RLZZ511_1087 [Cyanobacteriota bacterium]|jgi:hypothetical protein